MPSLMMFSVPTGDNTQDNDRQQKIKMLERLKYHMVKQIPPEAEAQVCCQQSIELKPLISILFFSIHPIRWNYYLHHHSCNNQN